MHGEELTYMEEAYMLIVALGVFFGQAYLWVYIKQYVTFRRVDFKSSSWLL